MLKYQKKPILNSPFPTISDNARIGIINRGEAAVRFVGAVKDYNLTYNTQLKSVAFVTESEQFALFSKMANYSFTPCPWSCFA